MFDQSHDLSNVQPQTDGEHFRTITGRNLGAHFRHSVETEKSLHEGQRKQFEAMTDLADACEQLASNVEAEKRRDDVLKLADLRIDTLGALVASQRGEIIPGAPRLEMMEQSWSQLINRAPQYVPSRLRSNANSWLRDSNATAVARSMEAPGGKARECYALVTEKFQPHDADLVAHEVARAMPADCKGQIKYMGDGGRFEIEAVLARPFDVGGDIHRVIIGVRSSDDGTMSQQIWFKAWRLKCLNGMFIADKKLLRRVWHKGNAGKLQQQFADGLVMARNAIESFSAHWKRAQQERFVDAQTGANLTGPEALIRLIGHGDVAVPYIRPVDLMGRFQTAWETEPGDSIADVLNAITRAGHTTQWKAGSWTTEMLEEIAGRILYQRSVALPALDAKQIQALAA